MRPALALALIPLVLGAGCSSDSDPAGADTAGGGDSVDTVNIDVTDTGETADAPNDTTGDTGDGVEQDTNDTNESDTSPTGDTLDTVDTPDSPDAIEEVSEDTTTADTNAPEAEVTADPCPVVGRYERCSTACGPYQLPMRQCLSSGWDECACLTFGHDRIASGGGSERAGFVDLGAGGRYACYADDGALVLAYQPRGGSWSVQPIGVDGVHCHLAPGAEGEALLAYGASNAPERGHSFHYRTVSGGVMGPVTVAGNTPNYRGVGPRIARAPNGDLHAISVEERSSGNSLRTYQLTAGTTQNLEDLQRPPFEQTIAICDDGTQLIAWADMAPDIWITYIGARVTTSWRSKFLPWEVQYLGQGMALDCRGGRSYGVMQDLSRGQLVFFTSATPADPASYLSYEVPTGGSVGRFSDLHVDSGNIWVSWVTTDGEVRLSVRPADLSSDWVSYKVVDRGQMSTGVLGGDVELAIGEDGLPVLMFFGVVGADEGPWTATLR